VEPDPPIVVFDGVCPFCSGAVRAILRHDRDRTIRFAPLQSPAGARLMRGRDLDPLDAETFLFVKGGRAYVRSDAAVEVARLLRFPWRGLAMLRWVPRPLREAVYRAVARNRYRWFGKRDACFVPRPEERRRFLDAADVP
jgi:predicted DCC family thiol-disulfide oxidoreductase YuxK